MPEQKRPSTCVVSLRCSLEQRSELERRAAGKQVGVYLRSVLFPANDNAPLPRRLRYPSRDDIALAKALAQLGQLVTDLRERSRAAEFAALPAGDDLTSQDIHRLLADIKSLLMKGLGVRER
jgi:hypothetical protein